MMADGQRKEDEEAHSLVERKLNEWKLAQYVKVFQDNEVDEDAFLIIEATQLAELIPLVGPRTKFLANRSAYLKSLMPTIELSDAVNDTASTSSSLWESQALIRPPVIESREEGEQQTTIDEGQQTTNSRPPTPTDCGERLIRLLKAGVRSNALLSLTRLSDRGRKTLCGAIVDHLLSKNKKPTAEEFSFWANQVPKVFHHEQSEVYYRGYRGGPNKRLASGKLWDRYNNEKKHIQPKRSARATSTSSTNGAAVIPEDIENALAKLRVISPTDTDVQNLWRSTARYRDKEISISEYYQQYPILSTTVGISLIRIDFEEAALVPDAGILIKTWIGTAKKVLSLAKEKGICKDIFNCREQASIETLGFIVLPYLFRTFRVKTKAKVWRPSQPEVAQAFIMQITSMGDYCNRLTERREKLFKYGLTLQPFVLTVGTTTSYSAVYVVVGETKYECSSLMAAVDLCFKTTWALNAKYQTECEAVWNFIQRFVYDISAENICDKTFQSVLTVWSELQGLPSDR